MSSKVITAETVRNYIFWEVNIAGTSVPTFRRKIILTRARYVKDFVDSGNDSPSLHTHIGDLRSTGCSN